MKSRDYKDPPIVAVPCALRNRGGGKEIEIRENDDKSNALTSVQTDSLVFTLRIRGGCDGGGKGALIQNDKSGTLSCNNDQTLFVINGQGGADYLITENVTDALTAATNSSGNNKLVVVLKDNPCLCYTKTSFGQYAEGIGTLRANGGDIGGERDTCYQQTIGALCADDYKGPNRQYVDQDKLVVVHRCVQPNCGGYRRH